MNSLRLFTSVELDLNLTVIEYKGAAYFVPSEVGEALGYSNLSHSIHTSDGFIKDVDYRVFSGVEFNDLKVLLQIGNTDLQITNMTRSITLLTESGLNAVLLKSTKPGAVKIRVWITSEVMPSLMRTGQYLPAQNSIRQQALEIFEIDTRIAELMGCPKHIGVQEATKAIKRELGIDYVPLLSTSKYMENVPTSEEMLEPTDIGKKYGMSGKKVNLVLKAEGLQVKNGNSWEAIGEGIKISTKHAWSVGNKTGYNLKWNISKIQHLFKKG